MVCSTFRNFSVSVLRNCAFQSRDFDLLNERNDVVVHVVTLIRPERGCEVCFYANHAASLLIAHSYKIQMAMTFGLIYENSFTHLWLLETSKLGKNSRLVLSSL